MTKCECGQEAAIHVFTKLCLICRQPKSVKQTEELTLQEKAEWLRSHGYYLTIYGCDSEQVDSLKWRASVEGQYRRFGSTIEDVVNQVYELIVSQREEAGR